MHHRYWHPPPARDVRRDGIGVKPPHGRREAEEFYGWHVDLYQTDSGTASAAWERDKIISIPLPAPLRYAGRPVNTMRVHHKLAGVFHDVYADIFRNALWHAVESYAGAYCFRLIRGGDSLSMHAFGAAVDHDPARNPLGAHPNDTYFGSTPAGAAVREIFKRHQFTWGGSFQGRKDCMHWQWGTGL